MAGKPISIEGEFYATRKTVETRLQSLLYCGGPDDLITAAEDVKLIRALFYARSTKVTELDGRNIVAWGREANPANVCFAAICADGSKLHFSYISSLTALYRAQGKKRDEP